MKGKLFLAVPLLLCWFNLFAQNDTIKISVVDTFNGYYIPYSLEDCFSSLNKILPDSIQKELSQISEDEMNSSYHFGLGMWIRNNWGLWAGTRLSVYFNELGIFHPDDMSAIILTSYHRFLNEIDINLNSQIQYYKDFWEESRRLEEEKELDIEKKKKSNLNWLKKNGIKLNDLPEANPNELIYTCDSTVLLKRINGDTMMIWTVGSEENTDTNRVKELIKNERFGRTRYIKGVNYQGNIVHVYLSQKKFYTKNDSLFELATFYKISSDSILNLMMEMFEKIEDTQTRGSLQEIIDQNSYQDFKLIFHPKIFQNGNYRGNKKGDNIELASVWEIDGKKYYEINIKNTTGEWNTKYTYLFDETYKLIRYDGCNSTILSQLTEENKVAH